MSKLNAVLIMLLAIGSGLIASVMVMRYIQQYQQPQQMVENGLEAMPAQPTIEVVTASQRLTAGTVITTEHVRLRPFLEQSVPPERFESTEEVVGRAVRTTLYEGEPILPERVSDPEMVGGMTAIIPDGMRAVTVRVDETAGVAGFVRPGHRVDILITMDAHGDWNESVTKTILQNVQVLATGQEIVDTNDGQPQITPTATVLVTLEQAERLALATSSGSIRMALRNLHDVEEEWTPGVMLTELIPREAPIPTLPPPVQVVEAPPPRPFPTPVPERKVELYRGSQRSEYSFPVR